MVPRSMVYLLLFVGLALIMHGVSEERVRAAQQEARVEYRFVPRTLYEEQLAGSDNILGKFKGMF